MILVDFVYAIINDPKMPTWRITVNGALCTLSGGYQLRKEQEFFFISEAAQAMPGLIFVMSS